MRLTDWLRRELSVSAVALGAMDGLMEGSCIIGQCSTSAFHFSAPSLGSWEESLHFSVSSKRKVLRSLIRKGMEPG